MKIYDIITKNTTDIALGKGVKEASKILGIDHSCLYKLGKETKNISHRFIREEDKNLLFTLVDFDSKQEYDCIDNASIFIYFNCPYSNNEGKYVYELKKKRQKFASICGRVFYLKGRDVETFTRLKETKFHSEEHSQIRHQRKLRGKIARALRKRVSTATKGNKSNKTEILIGCSIDFYLGFLSAKFKEGMTFENHGDWHIDHIIPCSSFDLTKPEEQLKCFHYSNTQPLWAKENLQKSDSLISEIS